MAAWGQHLKVSRFLVSTSLVLAFGLSGCSGNKENTRAGIDPTAETKASQFVNNSFQIKSEKNGADLNLDHAHLVILKSALNKEFLLSANMLTQLPTPMFNGLQSRVVYFIERDNKIIMVEASKTHQVGDGSNIEQKLILAQLPVVQVKDDSYEVDFNAGMNELFTTGAMYGSDESGTDHNYDLQPAKVKISYIDSASIKNNRVSIVQVAQLDQFYGGKRVLQPVEVRYYLEPYLPDQKFQPTRSLGFSKVGYFEGLPIQLENGDSRVYAMKWNTNKPMKFAISANTPAEWKEVLAQAVLSWNKILGENKLEVVQLEDKSITAPNADVNIIQWAQWDAAGYAYADAQLDPRSGEVLHAQIFFPSAFIEAAVSGRVRVNDLVLQNSQAAPTVGLKGFNSSRICNRNLMKELSALSEVRTATTAEIMKKAIKNYVIETVAHEVGHTLGLRHNFAGSLAANYKVEDREKMMAGFYQTGKVPEAVIATSSIMDYELFEESVWTGEGLKDFSKPALTYDKVALEHLYFAKDLPKQSPLFCTDSGLSVYADCQQFDAGSDTVAWDVHNRASKLKALPARILNRYIMMTKTNKEPVDVSDVKLDAKEFAATLSSEQFNLMSLLKANLKLIQVRGGLSAVETSDEITLKQQEQSLVAKSFESQNGAKAVFVPVSDDLAKNLKRSFNQIVEDPHFASGEAWGEQFTFTEDEKAVMKNAVAIFADKLQSEMIRLELRSLSGQSSAVANDEEVAPLADTDLSASLEDVLYSHFEQYGLGKVADSFIDVSVTPKGGGDAKAIKLPVYKYDQSLRRASLAILSVPHKGIDFGHRAKLKAADALDAELAVIGELDSKSELNLSRDGLRWLLNNRQLAGDLQ